MNSNLFTSFGFGAALLFSIFSSTNAADDSGDWIQLFNGKDLSDWTIKIRGHEAGVNHNDTFSVKDGVIKVSYDK